MILILTSLPYTPIRKTFQQMAHMLEWQYVTTDQIIEKILKKPIDKTDMTRYQINGRLCILTWAKLNDNFDKDFIVECDPLLCLNPETVEAWSEYAKIVYVSSDPILNFRHALREGNWKSSLFYNTCSNKLELLGSIKAVKEQYEEVIRSSAEEIFEIDNECLDSDLDTKS